MTTGCPALNSQYQIKICCIGAAPLIVQHVRQKSPCGYAGALSYYCFCVFPW